MRKEFLSPTEQIERLEGNGVSFVYISKEDALKYLRYNNNYYKLTAYRKNFDKDESGKYINLDFAYLKDLAIIDMRLRYMIMRLCLDVEHFEKVKLLDVLKIKGSDGYDVVEEYYSMLRKRSTPEKDEVSKLKAEIMQNGSSLYCKDILGHNPDLDNLPVLYFRKLLYFCQSSHLVECRNLPQQLQGQRNRSLAEVRLELLLQYPSQRLH